MIGAQRPSARAPFSAVALPELIRNNPNITWPGQDGAMGNITDSYMVDVSGGLAVSIEPNLVASGSGSYVASVDLDVTPGSWPASQMQLIVKNVSTGAVVGQAPIYAQDRGAFPNTVSGNGQNVHHLSSDPPQYCPEQIFTGGRQSESDEGSLGITAPPRRTQPSESGYEQEIVSAVGIDVGQHVVQALDNSQIGEPSHRRTGGEHLTVQAVAGLPTQTGRNRRRQAMAGAGRS